MRTDDAQYLDLIPGAKRQEQGALSKLVMFIDQRYSYLVTRLYSADPVLSREDIHSYFLEGVIGGIPKVSMEIGDPLFHLAQRGVWKAKSAVDSAKKYRRTEDLNDPEFGDAGADRTQEDPADIVVQRHFARHVTRVLSMAGLEGNEKRAFLLILTGDLGDPCEMGWNKKLARALRVSPQRASQITAKLHYVYGHEEAGVVWA